VGSCASAKNGRQYQQRAAESVDRPKIRRWTIVLARAMTGACWWVKGPEHLGPGKTGGRTRLKKGYEMVVPAL
jgi:hypothetical protein